jgi:hypothetical protein
VKLADPVAGYSSFLTRTRNFSDLGDSEQTPCDLGVVTDYAPMTAMLAPRAALLTFNARDNCCFAADHALPPLLAAAQPIYALYCARRNLRSHVNDVPGTHNYDQDNRVAFYRMLGDFFYPGDPRFDPAEIPCDREIKTREQFFVPLPERNADFHTLALDLSRSLPRQAQLPAEKTGAEMWQRAARDRLRNVVQVHDYTIAAEKAGELSEGDLKATHWRLKAGDDWTVPAVELAKGEPKTTLILVADAGRRGVSARLAEVQQDGRRVLAIDPF